VVIFEDYDKGVLTEANIRQFIDLARQHQGVPTVLTPRKRTSGLPVLHPFKPNLKELREGLN
jgi:bifunctional ADP-heptose synthase (sugar kinase/adenylyltransferase)